MNALANTIPAGHLQDAKGRLVPESQIKPIDRARDDLVRELYVKAEAVHKGAASVHGAHASIHRIDEHGDLPAQAWDTINAADAIIFGSPTYMGGPVCAWRSWLASCTDSYLSPATLSTACTGTSPLRVF